jgi:hypothetical protein
LRSVVEKVISCLRCVPPLLKVILVIYIVEAEERILVEGWLIKEGKHVTAWDRVVTPGETTKESIVGKVVGGLVWE